MTFEFSREQEMLLKLVKEFAEKGSGAEGGGD